MSEAYFGSIERDYDVASWFTTLQVLRDWSEVAPSSVKESEPAYALKLGELIKKDPEAMFDEVKQVARTTIEGDRFAFLRYGEFITRERTINQSLSDTAILICSDYRATDILQHSPFSRLAAISDELVPFLLDKHMSTIGHTYDNVPCRAKVKATRQEADFYLRTYDS